MRVKGRAQGVPRAVILRGDWWVVGGRGPSSPGRSCMLLGSMKYWGGREKICTFNACPVAFATPLHPLRQLALACSARPPANVGEQRGTALQDTLGRVAGLHPKDGQQGGGGLRRKREGRKLRDSGARIIRECREGGMCRRHTFCSEKAIPAATPVRVACSPR